MKENVSNIEEIMADEEGPQAQCFKELMILQLHRILHPLKLHRIPHLLKLTNSYNIKCFLSTRSTTSTHTICTTNKLVHFKPEYSGKPDEDAEAHLLRRIDWMDT